MTVRYSLSVYLSPASSTPSISVRLQCSIMQSTLGALFLFVAAVQSSFTRAYIIIVHLSINYHSGQCMQVRPACPSLVKHNGALNSCGCIVEKYALTIGLYSTLFTIRGGTT